MILIVMKFCTVIRSRPINRANVSFRRIQHFQGTGERPRPIPVRPARMADGLSRFDFPVIYLWLSYLDMG